MHSTLILSTSRARAWLLGVVVGVVGLIGPAYATRLALVIGNASYADRPLKNPVNDAQDLAAALRASGFQVTLKTNLSADQMKQAISDFGDALKKNKGTGLFYFSGHGVQTTKGNYLLPVGRSFKREKEVELFAVEARTVLDQMQQAQNPLNVLILDACRDNPLPAEEKSMNNKGLGRMVAPSGALIAFATAPGKTASDNNTERNGLYTKHLIEAINTPGLRLEDVFKRVGSRVEQESAQKGGDQSPEEVSKLRSEQPFYFKPGPATSIASVTPEPQPVAPFQYFVQVGAFTSAEDAQMEREKMRLIGLNTQITEREQEGRNVFRVRIGPFEYQDQAEQMQSKLLTHSVKTSLVRVQR